MSLNPAHIYPHLLNLVVLLAGSFFGLMGNIIAGGAENGNTVKRYCLLVFYSLGALVFLVTIWTFIHFGVCKTNIVASTLSALFLLVMVLFHRKYLNPCNHYTTDQLNPKIIRFTESAKGDLIKLFAGDLSFLGDSPDQMEKNQQYNQLVNKNFKQVSILCEYPANDKTKARYAKIWTDLSGVKFKCYKNDIHDIRVRGRIQKIFPDNYIVLVYERIESNKYRLIETDTLDSQCHLYVNIWNVLWASGKELSAKELKEWSYKLNSGTCP